MRRYTGRVKKAVPQGQVRINADLGKFVFEKMLLGFCWKMGDFEGRIFFIAAGDID